MGTTRSTVEDWLDWAQERYDAALERSAYGSRSARRTMESYDTLIGAISRGARSEPEAKESVGERDLRDMAARLRFIADSGLPASPADAGKWADAILRALDNL